ncbi:MAG: VCBS repeat-containing protein, partial [Planctomycetes bacterium]|nr:VCBS repeat-containing protein [Planctomycetota bacterium]
LLLCNIGLGGASPNDAPMLLLEVTDDNGNAVTDLLHGQSAGQVPFLPHLGGNRELPAATSAVVAADVDGNGLDEIVFVYQSGIETRLRRFGDETQGFVDDDVQIAANGSVTNVSACAVDLDLDGRDELAIGLTVGGIGRVTFWRFGGSWRQVGSEVMIQPDFAPSSLTLVLAAGNLDADARPEIAIAMQEVQGDAGSARCVVLDDEQNGFGVLRSEIFIERDENNVVRTALTCSLALGDVDGDGLDEILLAGLTDFPRQCEGPPVLLAAYEDGAAGFAVLGTRHFLHYPSGCNSPTDRRIRTVWINALDLDGDGRDEIAVNQSLFDDFVAAAPFTEVTDWQLDDDVVFEGDANFYQFDKNTSSFVVGDFTGDDREDLAVYHQSTRTDTVEIWGLPATSTTIQQLRTITATNNNPNSGSTYPMLLPVNVDTDSAVLSYSAAEYKLVFSEPIVLAALAAPPTRAGVGQNVAGSFTAFGNTNSTASESERSLTFSAGVTVGVNLDGGVITQSEFSLKDKLTVAATLTAGTAYELSKTILFTSAPTEDLVVFTSVPIDQYVYTILSHPDDRLVGEKVVVGYPRTPVTMQAERSFFNASVPERAIKIDGSVFAHTIGDPTTYPTLSEKNALRSARGGLQVGPIGVGQGGGSTEVTLQVGTAVSQGGSLEISYEREIEATAGGVVGGVTIGASASSQWKITSGSSTTYTGVVGAIDAANFAANRYEFGLFTYTLRDAKTGQQFEVLNYWVQ